MIEAIVGKIGKAAAEQIYGKRQQSLGKPTVVFYTQSEAEILIKEAITAELKKLELVK